MNKFIFDVDGTLTPSRGIIDPVFKEYFLDFCNVNSVYLVTGSDYPKTVEQLGPEICLSVKKIYNCSGNDVWEKGIRVASSAWKLNDPIRDWLLTELENSNFDIKTGNHIEERIGTVNFSIVGRNANPEQRKQYVEWDRKTNERVNISTRFNERFPKLEARVGGETGLDIHPIGKDKGQVISEFSPKDNLFFFGDKTEEGGNDFPLAEKIINMKRGAVFQVKSWGDTFEILGYLAEAKVTR
jgi:phosphomannomutase